MKTLERRNFYGIGYGTASLHMLIRRLSHESLDEMGGRSENPRIVKVPNKEAVSPLEMH